MRTTSVQQTESTYRIGAVSRLTGVAPDTLRVWERRYGAVVPFRSGAGTRLYNEDDVGRLTMIKYLVDRGDAIGIVANLDEEQLQERAKGAPMEAVGAAMDRPCRVAVLGSTLSQRLASDAEDDEDIELVGLIANLNAFEAYSEECEVFNVDDAALHAFLHSATARARSVLEKALAKVMEADGIMLEDAAGKIGLAGG